MSGPNRNPKGVSVVVPCHNGERHLEDLLAALHVQDELEWQLVVVDDASTDSTPAILGAANRWHEPATFLRLPRNVGKPTALNLGVSCARYDKLVFLDQDDVPNPGYLRSLAGALERHEAVRAAVRVDRINDLDLCQGLFRSDVDYFAIPFRCYHKGNVQRVSVPVTMGGTLALRSEAIRRIGGFDPCAHACDDLDLCIRLWREGIDLVTVPAAILDYRLRKSALSLLRQRIRYGRAWSWLYARYSEAGIVRPTHAESAGRLLRIGRRLIGGGRPARHAAVAELGFALGRAIGDLALIHEPRLADERMSP